MVKMMWNRLFLPEMFTPRYYVKHYECIIPLIFMFGDCCWMAASTYHGFKDYDIIVRNSARDRHEEYDQFLKFHHHQWWVAPGITESHAKPRRELYDLYIAMEKKAKNAKKQEETCEADE